MHCSNFTGRVFSECLEEGSADVDIEFTRSGISAMASTGQVFEVPFSRCAVLFAGAGRRLIFCREIERDFAICCAASEFPEALSEASQGLLDMQLERLNCVPRRPAGRSFLAVNVLVGIMTLVAAVYSVFRL